MWLIYSRLLIRLVLLVMIVFSIFYFYVFGYKYTKDLWFSKDLGLYNVKYISNQQTSCFWFNGKKYFIYDWDISLFGLDKNKCLNIKIWSFKKFICNRKSKFTNIVYIPKKNIKLSLSKISFFKNLNIHFVSDVSVKYQFVWKRIKFLYLNNWDLLYVDSISTKKLINIPNAKFIWYNDKWLFLILKWQIYFLRIIK